MKIGELAKLSGVSVDALRFYEEKGLIKPICRTDAGYRQYEPTAVAQVGFLKTAQALGFSLQEIADVMPALAQGGLRLEEVRQHMLGKLVALDQQIERLQQLRHQVVSTMGALQCDASTLVSAKDLTRPKGAKDHPDTDPRQT
jgi:MerR family copper efflux transcriptional regulator